MKNWIQFITVLVFKDYIYLILVSFSSWKKVVVFIDEINTALHSPLCQTFPSNTQDNVSAYKASWSNHLCAHILYSSLWWTWQALWHPHQLEPHFLSISCLQIRSPCCSYAKCCNSASTQTARVASSLSLTLLINGSASLSICSSASAWLAFMIMRLCRRSPYKTANLDRNCDRMQVAKCFRLLRGTFVVALYGKLKSSQ